MRAYEQNCEATVRHAASQTTRWSSRKVCAAGSDPRSSRRGGAADRVAHVLDGDGEVRQRVAVVSDPDDVGARAVE